MNHNNNESTDHQRKRPVLLVFTMGRLARNPTLCDHLPSMTASKPITIYIDADACPVKDEAFRVAERYGLKTLIVANAWFRVPRSPMIEQIVVSDGFDAADDWIAERAGPGDIVITADVPLADRCVKARATVISPTGKFFDETSIGMALATRNLMDDLRAGGGIIGGPKPFSRRDRSSFLSALDLAVVRLKRDGFGN